MANKARKMQVLTAEVMTGIVTLIAGMAMLASITSPQANISHMVLYGLVITIGVTVLILLWLDPDRIRAGQSNAVLNLASRMLAAMRDGLDQTSAQRICEMLLPATNAIAIAITDKVDILGYAGAGQSYNTLGTPIRTHATHATIADGRMRVLYSSQEIGFPEDHHIINAAILVPLTLGNETVGTLKFYFPRPRNINETQQSIAAGFGELLSTQLAAIELEEQKKLATSMELRALQAQINPHFLFNTLNTIASFTRTDPDRARTLLREFSKFYRGTLENASDLIPLARELDQTQRYLKFEIARFGEDRLEMVTDVPQSLIDTLVPAFLIQPLVENAVKHAMPAKGKLTVSVTATAQGRDLLLEIADDGVGMDEDQLSRIMSPQSDTGLGIAVGNIHDRVQGYYGGHSNMAVDSTPGEGTRITLLLDRGCIGEIVL